MSSRALRKMQCDEEVENASENENPDLAYGGARKKQFGFNRYNLLNEESISESEVKEDDNETEATKSCERSIGIVRRKKKKKKKVSKRHAGSQRSSEDNADFSQVREHEKPSSKHDRVYNVESSSNVGLQPQLKLLTTQHRLLNARNELKRIFGSNVVQSEHKRKNRGNSNTRFHTRSTWITNYKDTWPPLRKLGVSMSLLENKNGILQFTFEHSTSYRQVQQRFLDAVESSNPDNIVDIVKEYPYHVDALIQLSDLCKLSEDYSMAADLIERAIYFLESAFHPLFNITQGRCQLDYRRQENRSIYIAIFKHLIYVGDRACCRTSLELCKLLLSFSSDDDPIAAKLAIDFYAIRAKEYQWLIDFSESWEASKNLSQLPNFAYSVAMAYFYANKNDTSAADNLLQTALIMFPTVLAALLDKCSIHIDTRVTNHDFFGLHGSNAKKVSKSLTHLITLYVNRCYHLWKDYELLPWLERNVHSVLDRVDKNDPFVDECQQKVHQRFQGPLPRSICRHIFLSDEKALSPNDLASPIVSFDPFPPSDSINIYVKPTRPTDLNSGNSTTINIFFHSLLPSFNLNETVALMERDEEENGNASYVVNSVDFRQIVTTFIGTVRNLLANAIPEAELPNNDADVDEDYDDVT